MNILIAFLSLTLLFASCSKEEKKMNELRLSAPSDPTSLDPRKGGDVLSSTLHFMLFECLLTLNPDGSVSPAQCSSFTLSNDLKTYTFHLGKTLWSDGSPVTSDNFAKAWKKILSPSFPCPNAQLLYPIKNAENLKKGLCSTDDVGIYTPDEKTLIVELTNSTPYFPELLTFCVFAPVKEELDEINPSWGSNADKTFISNGPFCLSNWSHQKELTLSKNPLYRNAEKIRLDSIQISILASDTAALDLYKKGQLDLLGDPFSPITAEMLLELPKEEILNCPVGGTSFVAFNTNSIPFSNLSIRKALSLALHREEIVQNILAFGEKPAFSAVPPSLKRPSIKNTHFYSDNQKEEAQKLLADGLKSLKMTKEELEESITYLYCHTQTNHVLAQLIQEQWKKNLDITVNLRGLDHKTLIENLSKKNYTLAQTFYRAQYQDPMSILERFQAKENTKNYPSWEDVLYKKLLTESFSENGEARAKTLEAAECILIEQVPFAPIYHLSLCYAKKPYVQGVELSPSGGIFFERLFLVREDNN